MSNISKTYRPSSSSINCSLIAKDISTNSNVETKTNIKKDHASQKLRKRSNQEIIYMKEDENQTEKNLKHSFDDNIFEQLSECNKSEITINDTCELPCIIINKNYNKILNNQKKMFNRKSKLIKTHPFEFTNNECLFCYKDGHCRFLHNFDFYYPRTFRFHTGQGEPNRNLCNQKVVFDAKHFVRKQCDGNHKLNNTI